MRWPWVLVAVACAVGLLALTGDSQSCYDAPHASATSCTSSSWFPNRVVAQFVVAALAGGLVGSLWRALRRGRPPR